MNANEIVMALRCCNKPRGHRCSECTIFGRYEYGTCKSTVDRLAADLIESLQAQLAKSQRREKAAVEDILTAYNEGLCAACNSGTDPESECINVKNGGRCKWQWRGPREGEKE